MRQCHETLTEGATCQYAVRLDGGSVHSPSPAEPPLSARLVRCVCVCACVCVCVCVCVCARLRVRLHINPRFSSTARRQAGVGEGLEWRVHPATRTQQRVDVGAPTASYVRFQNLILAYSRVTNINAVNVDHVSVRFECMCVGVCVYLRLSMCRCRGLPTIVTV